MDTKAANSGIGSKPLMAFEQVANVLICCHAKANPDAFAWANFTKHVQGQRGHLNSLRTLVWTLGGGPTPDQRKLLNQALGGKASLAAVISPHPAVRFIVSALSLTNRDIRVFSPAEVMEAFLYLGLTQDSRRVALQTLDRLRASVA